MQKWTRMESLPGKALPGTLFLGPKPHCDLTEHLVRRCITLVFSDRFSLPEFSLWAMETIRKFSSIMHSPQITQSFSASTLTREKILERLYEAFRCRSGQNPTGPDVLERLPPTELSPEVTSNVTFISYTEKNLFQVHCQPQEGTEF